MLIFFFLYLALMVVPNVTRAVEKSAIGAAFGELTLALQARARRDCSVAVSLAAYSTATKHTESKKISGKKKILKEDLENSLAVLRLPRELPNHEGAPEQSKKNKFLPIFAKWMFADPLG